MRVRDGQALIGLQGLSPFVQVSWDSEISKQQPQKPSAGLQSVPPLPIVSPSGSCCFTRLVQFGMLLGVGESYVRQATIRSAAERASMFSGKLQTPLNVQSSSTSNDWVHFANAGVRCLSRLASDIALNPSPENATDIVSLTASAASSLILPFWIAMYLPRYRCWRTL